MSKENLKLVVALTRTHSCLVSAIEQSLEPTGLGISEFGVLEYLLHKGDQPVQKVAEKILVSSGTITYTIDKLQKKGLVLRKQCEKDKRVYYVSLTAEGNALITAVFRGHESALSKLFKGLSPTEKSTLIQMLIKLQESIRSSEI